MAVRSLTRWSGLALLLSGLSSMIVALLHPNNYALNGVLDPFWRPAHIVEGLASLLMVLGLVGLHLRQAEKAGRLGLIGFILALFGSAALVNTAMLFEAYVFPYLASQQAAPKSALDLIDPAGPLTGALLVETVSSVVSGLGWFLISLATLRAGVLPRWAGWLLIGGIVLASVSFLTPGLWFFLNTSSAVFGIGLAWLGYALWSETSRTNAMPPIPAA